MAREIILVIDPGSTSTKVALFEGEKEIVRETLRYSHKELDRRPRIQDQLDMRLKGVMDFLKRNNYSPSKLDMIAARGGFLPPLNAGAYRIDKTMVDLLAGGTRAEHASNLAAQIGALIGAEKTPPVPAIIYDGVSTNQLIPLVQYSGSALLTRESNCHCLNMRAVCFRLAENMDREYKDLNLIVAHLGGGISLSLHSGGRMIDIVSDDEGPMSPERAGKVPCRNLVNLCYSGRFTKDEMQKQIRGQGGLKSYLGTHDALEIEDRIAKGDKKAEEVLEALALQVAKSVGELSVVVDGRIDRIIITGGMARSPFLVPWITKRVAFIAPVKVIPGEFELEALAAGGLRVLRGEEAMQELKIKQD